MNYTDTRAKSLIHLKHPEPGDYWNEHFCPVCLVVDVGKYSITFLKHKIELRDGWMFDTTKLTTLSRKEWEKWLSYGSIPGTWADCFGKLKGWEEVLKEIENGI